MSLLERMLTAHGGRDWWTSKTSFSAYASIGGALIPPLPVPREPGPHRPGNGGIGDALRHRPLAPELAIEGEAQRPLLRIFGATDAAIYGVYTPERCALKTRGGDDCEVRPVSFAAISAWPAAQALAPIEVTALIGAILWNTVVGPFAVTLGGRVTEPLAAGTGRADASAALAVHLPRAIDPITPERRLIVRPDGLIDRAEYGLAIIGNRRVVETMGAYGEFCGFRIPTLRRIALIDGAHGIDPSPLIDIEIFDVSIA